MSALRQIVCWGTASHIKVIVQYASFPESRWFQLSKTQRLLPCCVGETVSSAPRPPAKELVPLLRSGGPGAGYTLLWVQRTAWQLHPVIACREDQWNIQTLCLMVQKYLFISTPNYTWLCISEPVDLTSSHTVITEGCRTHIYRDATNIYSYLFRKTNLSNLECFAHWAQWPSEVLWIPSQANEPPSLPGI